MLRLRMILHHLRYLFALKIDVIWTTNIMICDDKPSARYCDEVRRWENGCAEDDEGVKQKLGLF